MIKNDEVQRRGCKTVNLSCIIEHIQQGLQSNVKGLLPHSGNSPSKLALTEWTVDTVKQREARRRLIREKDYP